MANTTSSEVFKTEKEGRRPLFEAAAFIFAKKGYREATVDEIAQAAGVAPKAPSTTILKTKKIFISRRV